jgi:hypothetical protein
VRKVSKEEKLRMYGFEVRDIQANTNSHNDSNQCRMSVGKDTSSLPFLTTKEISMKYLQASFEIGVEGLMTASQYVDYSRKQWLRKEDHEKDVAVNCSELYEIMNEMLNKKDEDFEKAVNGLREDIKFYDKNRQPTINEINYLIDKHFKVK